MLDTLANNPIIFVINIFVLIISLAVHEFAHAKAADHLGDPTPAMQGRLTLNPKAHIDMFGLLFLVLAGFGWGKPVEFDPFNLRNPRRDAAIISIAGPLSNFSIALVCSALLHLFTFSGSLPIIIIGGILESFVVYNLILGIFNLIPVHPLDGFKIVGGILPHDKAEEWYQLARYGMVFLIAMMIPFNGQSMIQTIMSPLLNPLITLLLP